MGNSKRPTLAHSGMQETMDEDDRSASLIAIQEAQRIMIMQYCRQSWEDSERTIDRKTGGAKGKQNTGTIATDTRPVATQQVANGRRKPAKAMDSQSTDFPLDTEAHKDATLPTQQQTHFQSPESPTQRAEDILTGSTQGKKSPNKSSSSTRDKPPPHEI